MDVLVWILIAFGPLVLTRAEEGEWNNVTDVSHREGRFFEAFPFYTIGRFRRTVCMANSQLEGTCIVRGECRDTGGLDTGLCPGKTRQAVCCVYQRTCGATTTVNNTYFYNTDYPTTYPGGEVCSYGITRCNDAICQLRIEFLDFSLAPPNGDGVCNIDYITVTGGNSRVPRICGENTGQHVYVDFRGNARITVSVFTSSAYTFPRRWHFKMSQIACDSEFRAPSGCLQYYLESSGMVKSFNYASGANPNLNSIGVDGSRQIANMAYGICVRQAAMSCSITWSQSPSDPYSFTLTNDVGSVDPALLGTDAVQSLACTTDFITIPGAQQNGALTTGDRICGLGMVPTTSNAAPFVVYVTTDGNENPDIGNRGFYLVYSQNGCDVPA